MSDLPNTPRKNMDDMSSSGKSLLLANNKTEEISGGNNGATVFQDGTLPELPFKSQEDLNKYEASLQDEFKTLSHEYTLSRQSRINHMISAINYYLKILSENDKNWSKIYNFEIDTIQHIKTNTEDMILTELRLSNTKDVITTLDEYELELAELLDNIQSPLEFDEIFSGSLNKKSGSNLPFPLQFEAIIKQYEQQLKAVTVENNYQTNLVKTSLGGNRMILWKQYYNELLSYKKQKITETYEELNKLHKEYNHVDDTHLYINDTKNYNKSVISINDLKPPNYPGNQDGFYHTDNRMYKNNRIELTNIKQKVLYDHKTFSQQQNINNSHRDVVDVKLNGCTGLSQTEIDHDLLTIRNKGRYEVPVDEDVQMEVDIEDEVYSPEAIEEEEEDDDEEEEEDDEEEEEEDEEYLSQDDDESQQPNEVTSALYQKYRHILSANQPPLPLARGYPDIYQPPPTPHQYRIVMPALPPLDRFPKLST